VAKTGPTNPPESTVQPSPRSGRHYTWPPECRPVRQTCNQHWSCNCTCWLLHCILLRRTSTDEQVPNSSELPPHQSMGPAPRARLAGRIGLQKVMLCVCAAEEPARASIRTAHGVANRSQNCCAMIFKQLSPSTAAESRVSHAPDEDTLSLMSSKVMCPVRISNKRKCLGSI
jgi:hypothetical protein